MLEKEEKAVNSEKAPAPKTQKIVVALYVRYLADLYHPGDSPRQQLQALADLLHQSGIETEEVTDRLSDRHYDFLFSIGGDGTLLSSVHLIGSRNIPVLGINFGHLGFLTTAGRDDLDTLVADLLTGRYTVEPRTLLHIETVNTAKEGAEAELARTMPNAGSVTEGNSEGRQPSFANLQFTIRNSQLKDTALNEVTLHRLDDGTPPPHRPLCR